VDGVRAADKVVFTFADIGSTNYKGDVADMEKGKMGTLNTIGGAASCNRENRQDLIVIDNTMINSDEAMDILLAVDRISRSSLRAGSVYTEAYFAKAVDVIMKGMRMVDEQEWRDEVEETDKLMGIKVKALMRNDPRLLVATGGNGECVNNEWRCLKGTDYP